MTRVLLVDDHELVRTALARFLASQGDIEIVGQACSAEEAWPLLEQGTPDVVTVDLGLPGVGGLEFSLQLLARRPEQAVLIVSSRLEPVELQMLVEAGVLGYVSKVASGDELVLAVRSVARGRNYFCAASASALVAGVRRHEPESPLSSRQLLVLQQMARGRTTREIAEEMCLSPKTVEKYRGEILRRLKARNQVEALEAARKLNILPA